MKNLEMAGQVLTLLDFKKVGLSSGLIAYANKKPQFKIYTDSKEPISKYRWQIKMSSDIVAASSQGYATRQLCLENAKSVMIHLIELNKEGKLI